MNFDEVLPRSIKSLTGGNGESLCSIKLSKLYVQLYSSKIFFLLVLCVLHTRSSSHVSTSFRYDLAIMIYSNYCTVPHAFKRVLQQNVPKFKYSPSHIWYVATLLRTIRHYLHISAPYLQAGGMDRNDLYQYSCLKARKGNTNADVERQLSVAPRTS
jgi:hypothetical protein